MADVLAGFPTLATAADFDPLLGLVKLWHFGDHSAAQLCGLRSAPEALGRIGPLLQRHGLRRVFCTGVDLSTAGALSWVHQMKLPP